MTDWKQKVRDRLEKGETITGVQVREEVGRRVPIYTFLEQLEEREGWQFEKLSQEVEGYRLPVTHYRLIGKSDPHAPAATGPRTNLPKEDRPTDVVVRRLLAGEELEARAVAEELGVTSSLLSYVKGQLKQTGYRFDERRDGMRVFVKLKEKREPVSVRKPGRPRKQLDKVIDVPTPTEMEFGPFNMKLGPGGKVRL